jgi:hypothetical protein
MLFKAFKRLEDTEIPLVLMPKLRSESEALENPGEVPLIVLFERISSGGTRLSPGELLFSMIKTDCPEAHDLVENIHKTKVKHLLSATDLVLTAFRLADFESQPSVSPKIDTPDPGPSDFHRRYKGAAKNKLLEYLNDGSIENAFNTLYDIVIYDPERNPNGYPQLMMPFLSRPLIQTLIFWIMKNQAAGKTNPDLQTSMGDIAAFFLHWHLCAFDRNTASKACFKIIDTAPLGLFPAKALYHELVTADESKGKYASMWVMPSPDDIKVKLDVTRSERLRSVSERFRGSSFEQQEINVLEKFWWGKGFLLWIQRDYLSREFINHDALAGKEDEESVPYDYDHLCPQYEWRADFRNITRNSPNLSEPCRNSLGELWRRAHTGDSIGNFHILAASDNRSVGKESFPEKMKLLTQHNWQYADGALPIENIHLWNKTAGENGVSHCWTDDRVKDFQEAVDRRFLYLYSLYYNASKVII